MKDSARAKKGGGEERRRARRTAIQEGFQLYLAIPQTGMVRISLNDISKVGLSFRSDFDLGLKLDQSIEGRIYLNPAFYLPFAGKIVRMNPGNVGVEFTEPASASVQALGLLQEFFEVAAKAGVLVE